MALLLFFRFVVILFLRFVILFFLRILDDDIRLFVLILILFLYFLGRCNGRLLMIIIVVVIVVAPFLILERSLLFFAVVVLKLNRFQLLVDQIHKGIPDSSGPCGALKSAHALGSITSDPYSGRIVMCKTAEPAVLGIVSRTGLAGAGHAAAKS